MSTAVITRPSVSAGTEPFVVGLTHHVFSGLDSYVTTNSAPNMMRRIGRWEWTFPDGQTKSGGVVQWCPNASGTGNVQLTVYGDDGLSNTATLSVTVASSATFNTNWFIRSDGADSGGSHDGSANDSAHAWLTLCKSFQKWRDNGNSPAWLKVSLNAGDTVTARAGADATDPDYGALEIVKLGAGANPIVSALANVDVGIAADGNHDAGSLWSNPSIMDGIDVSWPSPQVEGSGGAITSQHPNNVIRNGIVTNSKIAYAKITAAADQLVLYNQTIKLGQFKGGFACSGGTRYVVCDTCLFQKNGNDAGQHHQSYITSASVFGFNDTIADQNGATAYSGFKNSGSSKLYYGRVTCLNCHVGFDIGGNPGEQMVDVCHDAPVVDGAEIVAFYTNYVLRYSNRNARIYGGCSQEVFREQSNSAGEFVDTVDIYHLSANLITGQFCDFVSNSGAVSWFTGVTVKNCAVVKANAGVFYTLQYSADVSKVAIDYNVYWRVGGTPDADATFATVQGATKTWAQWQALGLDTHSKFRDPLFYGAKDLRLQAGSPCLDAGTPIGVVSKDCAGILRPQNAAVDIGAFEMPAVAPPPPSSSGGGSGSSPSIGTAGNPAGDRCSATGMH